MSAPARLAAFRKQVDETLERLLPAAEGPAAKVSAAMRYAVLGGGKRLRPCVTLACCAAAGGRPEDALKPAAALELVHAYSLVHDDLPAMDDDDLRRGRATVHRAFDEATAILAGDALLTLAFEVLGSYPEGGDRAELRAEAVVVAARAAGGAGMVGGQQADLDAEGLAVDPAALEWIHRHKTGSLLCACAEIGAIHARAPRSVRLALAAWGESVGLAFQMVDDVLDLTATAEVLGKTPGKDRDSRKATYPALIGLDASKVRAAALVDGALAGLAAAGIHDELLDHLARVAISRTS